MAPRTVLAAALVWLSPAPLPADHKPAPAGRVERLDPGLDAVIPDGAAVEVLATGFGWAEGPVWVADGGHLLFSDVERNTVFKWSQKEGLTEFLKPSGFTTAAAFTGREPGSNGLALDPAGRLVLCQHGDRRVARWAPDGKFVTLADRYRGKRLNSPNDLAFGPAGAVYFTDPPYGLPGGAKDPAKELDFQGVYRVAAGGGDPQLLTRDLSRPNGIAFAPDFKTLYVANSDPDRPVVMAYPVDADGAVGAGKVLYDAAPLVREHRPGLPDGLKADRRGHLFVTGPGGVLVLSPAGKLLGVISVGGLAANCAFGDDGSSLYVTADDKLVRVKTATNGLKP